MSEPRRHATAALGAGSSGTRKREDTTSATGEITVLVNGIRLQVSPELEAAVHRAHKGLLAPQPSEMTTTQAAEFLDVSRPFVIKVIEQGDLPCRMVGKHRRIPTTALVEYRERMFHQAKQAADEMTRTAEALGLYEDEAPKNAK